MKPNYRRDDYNFNLSIFERDDTPLSGNGGSHFETSSQDQNSSGQNSMEIFGFSRNSLAAVSCSRWIFLGALLVAASGLATAVFLTLDNEQHRDFTVEVSSSIIILYLLVLLPFSGNGCLARSSSSSWSWTNIYRS